MTRLQTITDAAFAFAATLLVLSVGSLPGHYTPFAEALEGTPA